jgi:polysaccharide pyruvyl transferase WcaK-like protein
MVDGVERPVSVCGARRSRRLYRRESYVNMRVSGTFGGVGSPGLAVIDSADAVLDVSGGDSFSDLYGRQRYHAVAWPKRLALYRRRPLILLPQTYGPFRDKDLRKAAVDLTRRAAVAWARDAESFAELRGLLGEHFDPARHRLGVDMAFALPAVAPPSRIDLPSWFFDRDDTPVVGLNVSGLLALDPHADRRYALRAAYLPLIERLLARIVEDGSRVLLVPHVISDGDGHEADHIAQSRVLAAMPRAIRERIACSPPVLDPSETKWLISQVDWFCGTRMHSTIAGLASGVATAAIAYSYKTRGVFETCGMRDHVVDAREVDTQDAVDRLFELYQRRKTTKVALLGCRDELIARAETQMDEIVEAAGARMLERA